MKKKFNLSASVICADFENLSKEIKSLKRGKIDRLHFDVMDGVFVPRYGLFPELIPVLKKHIEVPLEVHMMVSNPEIYLESFKNSGLSEGDLIIVHAESTSHLDRVLKRIKSLGIRSGVALNPSTTLQEIKYIVNDIDLVLVMGINPGITGQVLIPYTYDKIQEAVKFKTTNPHLLIEVDGGVNFSTSIPLLSSGADILVCGTQTIFRPEEASIYKKISELRSLLKKS